MSYSKIQKQVLDSVPGIESISLSPALEYRFLPTSNVAADYQFEFKNPIFHPHDGHKPGVVYSSQFNYASADGTIRTIQIEDDGFGKLRAYETINNIKQYLDVDFGTVNYAQGVVSFNEFALSSPDNSDIKIYAVIGASRVFSSQQYIIQQDSRDNSAISVSVSGDVRPDNRVNLVGEQFIGTTSVNSSNVSQGVGTITTGTSTTSAATPTGGSDSGGGGGAGSGGGGGGAGSGGGGGGGYGGGY